MRSLGWVLFHCEWGPSERPFRHRQACSDRRNLKNRKMSLGPEWSVSKPRRVASGTDLADTGLKLQPQRSVSEHPASDGVGLLHR